MSDNSWATDLLSSDAWSDLPTHLNTELAGSRFDTTKHYAAAGSAGDLLNFQVTTASGTRTGTHVMVAYCVEVV